ncbi:MAG: hypothetical protein JO029_07455 [Candidatus Eremiobacteraeota bacterium]|nr:hypothetical protein [Candidatus Eremiobacteraeota bacterium]MBV8434096.1 hypothetical protein [Candidatus Eremiobacteraeota bacterium]MBV8582749.1 hypothetical protein [Candidatus Eremiobacteraeota bacterium]
MALFAFAPGEEKLDPKHHIEAELEAFLEAFKLLEAGALPAEILKKIA